MGATNVRNQGPLVSARVPVSALGKLAADPALKYARSPLATTEALPAKAVSQGDESLRADIARSNSNVDGAGITVGVLSDSFACNPPAFLPERRLPARTRTSQRRAAAEHQHSQRRPVPRRHGRRPRHGAVDPRRGARCLALFPYRFESELDFADGIIRLRDAGADVIVDDVRYFAEPFFSDGMIAQAVDIVADGGAGVPYFLLGRQLCA